MNNQRFEIIKFCDEMLQWGAGEERAGEIALDICDRAINWGFMGLCRKCERDCKVPGVSPGTPFKFECRVYIPATLTGNPKE